MGADPRDSSASPASGEEIDIDLREALDFGVPTRTDAATDAISAAGDAIADSPPAEAADRAEPAEHSEPTDAAAAAEAEPSTEDGGTESDAPAEDTPDTEDASHAESDPDPDHADAPAPTRAAGGASDGNAKGDETAEEGAAPAGLLPADIYTHADPHAAGADRPAGFAARLRAMLMSPPARREEALDRVLEELRVRGLDRGVTVALGSIKGGVGKTTLTLSLADMLAESLRVGVLVVDADLEWGTAADSTPQESRNGGTLTDVLRARDRLDSPGDLAPFLTKLPRGASLLAGPTDPNEIEALHARDMQVLLEILRRFFPIILLDLSPGIGLRGTIPRWAFGAADEIVAIATPTRGSLRRASRMLSYLQEHHGDTPVTLALNMVPRKPDEAIRRVIHVAEHDMPSHAYAAIPRDEGLTRQLDAGMLNIDELDQQTRLALKGLARQLASAWCR